jgi:hypothetical protein
MRPLVRLVRPWTCKVSLPFRAAWHFQCDTPKLSGPTPELILVRIETVNRAIESGATAFSPPSVFLPCLQPFSDGVNVER